MDNEPRGSLKLMGAAGLAVCGVMLMAIGVGMAGVPVHGPVCMSLAPSLCCSLADQLMVEGPSAIAVPNLHALTILSD